MVASEVLRLELPYPPSVNHYLRHTARGVYRTAEADSYRQQVQVLALIQQVEPLSGELIVTLTLYRPAKRGDVDNYSKVVIDALNGIAWHDDGQIVELHIYRFDDKKNPRVLVEVQRR